MNGMPIRVVTSTVSGLAGGVAMVATTILVVAAVMAIGPVPLPVTLLSIAATGALCVVLVAPLRVNLSICADGIRYRSAGGRRRWIPRGQIVAAECVRTGPAAILGLGIPRASAVDRRIVRSGWTLHLRLRSAEEIWVSVSGPLDLPHDLDLPRHSAAPTNGNTVSEGQARPTRKASTS